jgi:hypothetical protein
MTGHVTLPADRPVVFSPFGLGVLDLAVGRHVYDEVQRAGELHVIDDFFHETAPVRVSGAPGLLPVRRASCQSYPIRRASTRKSSTSILQPIFGRSLFLKCEGFNFAGS